MKKLLFITLNDHVSWGGSEELWSKTALKLCNSHDVSILVKKWDNEAIQIKKLKSKGIKVLYKKVKKTPPSTFLNKLKRKVFPKIDKKTNSFDYTNYSHVVISIGDHLDKKLIGLTRQFIAEKVPYSIVVQLATDLRTIDDETTIKLLEAYKNAKRVFFLSDENILKTEITFGKSLKNKDKINNPFNYQQDYIPIEEKNYNIACVAAFTCFHKSQDLLITVLSQDKWRNRNITLNLYGNGINKIQLERLIKRYGLQEKIRLYGFVKDKTAIWKLNSCCIMPSRMEGQSLAMLEAMSYGRMVIATAVGDAERLVVNNKTGFLIEAPTLKHIDETLENAWNNRDYWIEYGKNARNHLFKLITIDPVEDFANKLKKII